ncbi:MAG: histidine kinase [Bacteroidetes bacterium]|nr:histidine kinase [Bacteroidota bacterium]
MKRLLLHLCFWIAYLSQDTLLAVLWGALKSGKDSSSHDIWLSFLLCVSLVPPKIIFTYFVLYVLMDRILKQNKHLLVNIFFLVCAIIPVLLSVRAIEFYFVYPVIFDFTPTGSYFNAFSFLFALIDLGYISGIAMAIKQVRLQMAYREREKNLIKEKLETELKFLRSQTNPHFLFNTLNNIYGLARRKSDDTAEAVMKLSKLLRFMLYESRNPLIKIEDEIKMLDNFINLEKIRYTKKLTVDFKREIDNEQEQVAPLLLLPFVENAFKHGASENRFDSRVDIDLKLNQGILVFCIENTKEECDENAIKGNIGLTNVRRQLELMYKEYDLKVDNQKNIFKVFLKINLRSYEKI